MENKTIGKSAQSKGDELEERLINFAVRSYQAVGSVAKNARR
jgi:hypothetical protein